MTEHRIPYADWHMGLMDAIDVADEGDTIYVHDEAMKMMAESAISRKRPNEKFIIIVEDDDNR